jgi:hypothetical protein
MARPTSASGAMIWTKLTNHQAGATAYTVGSSNCLLKAKPPSGPSKPAGLSTAEIHSASEFWFRHEHVDYEQLVRLADNTLDATEREIIDLHLRICTSCKDDLRSFLAFREQFAPELEVSYAPVEKEPTGEGWGWSSWWGGLARKPVYAAAGVVIGIAIVIGGVLLLKRTAENLQAQHGPTPQVSPVSTPDNRATNVPSPPATPNELPIEEPISAESAVVLNDHDRPIKVDKSGSVAGLDDVSVPIRHEIAQVLLSEKLERPAILKELGGQEGTLRGTNNAAPFKLTSPSRTVILTDRPTLKWEKASGASSYQVYVNDPAGHQMARSAQLPLNSEGWTLPKRLKRGGIYAWTVVAVVGDKEIVSPDVSSPEMRFRILSTNSLQQLNKLKKTRSHLALGVFYVRVGMIAEGEHEFQMLVRDNPRSQPANKLLREIQSWQRR